MRLTNSNRFRPLCRILLAALTGLLATASFAQAVDPTPADLRLVPQSQAQIKLSFAPVAKQVAPAVVNVYASRKVVQRQRVSPFFEDPFFRRFFGQPGAGNSRPRERVESSLGSGVIISADGTVITNHHVIKGADAVRVALSDRREFDADIVLMDERTDLAVLKIREEGPFEHVSFASSDSLEVGDIVLAIGNPFGVGQTVTQGIVSALARTQVGVTDFQFFIQTDAAINRGNSGGPLFNMAGEVIGVNTAIISPSGGSIGIGFSVPANIARNVVAQLQEFGQTRRGWLGVQIQQVTDELAESLGLSSASGALVASVVEDGPAASGAIEQGDVILRFDGRQVEEMRDLPRMVAETDVDKTVEVVVWRKGERETLSVQLGLLEAEAPVVRASAAAPPGEPEAEAEALGMTLVPMTPARRETYGIAADVEGVIVDEVDAAGAAAAKNIRPGDVVIEVGQEPVATPEEVVEKAEAAREAGRKSVLLLVSSAGQLRFIAVSLEE